MLPNPLNKGLFTTMKKHIFVAFTNSEKYACDLRDTFCLKMSRRSHAFFSELVNATKKWYSMVVNSPLSRGLGNIAKDYLITCDKSKCLKLKKRESCRNFNVEMPICILYINMVSNRNINFN